MVPSNLVTLFATTYIPEDVPCASLSVDGYDANLFYVANLRRRLFYAGNFYRPKVLTFATPMTPKYIGAIHKLRHHKGKGSAYARVVNGSPTAIE